MIGNPGAHSATANNQCFDMGLHWTDLPEFPVGVILLKTIVYRPLAPTQNRTIATCRMDSLAHRP